MSTKKSRFTNPTNKLQLRQKKKEIQFIQKAKAKRKFAGVLKYDASIKNHENSFYNKFFSGQVKEDDVEDNVQKFLAVDSQQSTKRKTPEPITQANEDSGLGLRSETADTDGQINNSSKPELSDSSAISKTSEKHKSKKPQPFMKEKLEWQKKQEEKRLEEEQKHLHKKQQREKRVQREAKRHRLMARSKTGQPIMRHMLSHLLEQIQTPAGGAVSPSSIPSPNSAQRVHIKR